MAGIQEGFPLLVFQLNVGTQVFLPDRGNGNSQFFVQIGRVVQQVKRQWLICGISRFGQQLFRFFVTFFL